MTRIDFLTGCGIVDLENQSANFDDTKNKSCFDSLSQFSRYSSQDSADGMWQISVVA